MYKRCVVKTTIVKDDDGRFFLSLPEKPSHYTVVRLGEDITYRMHLHEGEEVLALIGYKNPMSNELKSFNKQFGAKWSDIKNDPDYTKHWNYTKEDKLGGWDLSTDPPTYIPYEGADKNEPVKFKEFTEYEIDGE